GRSNAFEISKRLGLSDALINDAENHMGADSQTVDTMITSLEDARHAAEQDYKEAKEHLTEAENLKLDLEKELKKLENEKELIYEKAEEKAEKALKKAREEAEFVVSEIKSMRDQSNWKEHEWSDARKMLEEAQPNLTSSHKNVKQANKDDTLLEKKGDDIKHLTINQEGTVLEQTGKNEYLVQVSMIKLKAKRKDLEKVNNQKKETEQVSRIKRTRPSIKPELDLRGVRYEDAMREI